MTSNVVVGQASSELHNRIILYKGSDTSVRVCLPSVLSLRSPTHITVEEHISRASET